MKNKQTKTEKDNKFIKWLDSDWGFIVVAGLVGTAFFKFIGLLLNDLLK